MSDSAARALISRVTVDPYPDFSGGARRPRFARILAAPEAAETNLWRAAIADRITPRAATAFKRDYYAVKSHLAAARRLVAGVRVLRAPTLKSNLHALRLDRPEGADFAAAEPCALSRNSAETEPFARFRPCAQKVQGAFRRGRKYFSSSIYWGRTGNRDKLSRKNRDKG